MKSALAKNKNLTLNYSLVQFFPVFWGAFLGGALIDQAGVNAMLIFGTAATLIGALLLLFSAQKSRS